jgi:glyoxylase-like metal-dependent hydrolase (beta-lactamase superfamily II)
MATSAKPFASSADLQAKEETLEVIAPGVFALTAQGDPNVGAVEGEDFLVCIEARATPAAAESWLRKLREHTDKPVRYLVLTHYHAVRTLGAAAFGAEQIVASQVTADLIEERGKEDWDSEFGRMPRLFKEPDGIPGLTRPTVKVEDSFVIELGGSRGALTLSCPGRGHTAGDLIVWHEASRTLYAGDLVEAEAALYTGDAFHMDWSGGTLDAVGAIGVEHLIGGRGPVVHGRAAVDAAIAQTRGFLKVMIDEVGPIHGRGGSLPEAFAAAYAALAPRYSSWPIFEHVLPFNVQRLWDELDGVDWPRIWTAERDREVWAALQG